MDNIVIVVKIIENQSDFDRLSSKWNELLQQSDADTLFLTVEWMQCWWKNYGRPQLWIAECRTDSELVAIAPCCIQQQSWESLAKEPGFRHVIVPWGKHLTLRVLSLMGGGEVCSEYPDVICRRGYESAVATALLKAFNEHHTAWDVIDFSFVIPDSFIARYLQPAGTQSPFIPCVTPMQYTIHSAPLGKTWSDYRTNCLSRSFYKKTRCHTNKLQHHFPGAALVWHTCPVTIHQALASFFEMHQTRWENAGVSGAFTSVASRCFHQDFVEIAISKGWVRLGFLTCDDQRLFGMYGFLYKGNLIIYQLANPIRIHNLSLGTAAMTEVIEAAIRDDQATRLDMLRGDTDFKFHWTTEHTQLFQFQWVKRDFKSLCYIIYRKINSSAFLRELLRRFRIGILAIYAS